MDPGRIERVDPEAYHRGRRLQVLVFGLALALTRDYLAQAQCGVPARVLFPRVVRIVQRYLHTKVKACRRPTSRTSTSPPADQTIGG